LAGSQNAETLDAGAYQACCSYYHHNPFRKPDPCISPGDIKSYLDKTGKPVAFMAMAPSFLDAFSFSRGAVIGFFLSYLSDPFLRDHYGHHVYNYRALSIRAGKGAAKNAVVKSVFLPGQTGNPPNHSAGSFESLYHGSWLADPVWPAFHNFLLVPARRLYPFKTRFKFFYKNLPFHLGFGLLFLIPIASIFFLSFSPVGATLYYIEEHA